MHDPHCKEHLLVRIAADRIGAGTTDIEKLIEITGLLDHMAIS